MVTSAPDTTNLLPAPVANFTYTISDLTVSFADASTGGPISSWLWQYGDGNSGNSNPVSHIYPFTGSYFATLTVTNAQGCIDTVIKQISITTGIVDLKNNSSGFEIYPNPSSSFIQLKTKLELASCKIVIENTLGEKVLLLDKIPPNNYRLDVTKLPAGLYFVRLSTANGESQQAKFTKQ
jgi:hypothetical protein